jgi:predicted branched-subunit amino acid permease
LELLGKSRIQRRALGAMRRAKRPRRTTLSVHGATARVDNRSMPSMRQLASHPEFRRGMRDMTAISLGIAAWGLVTGVAMVKSGLGVPLSVLMSLLVYAGSAQLAALPLIVGGAPLWVIWATALCINLRFIVFSAQWRPYFGMLPLRQRLALGYFCADLSYVTFMHRFPEPKPAPEQVPYVAGGIVSNWTAWQVPSLIGILAADVVPAHWGLGFAGTLALLGLTYSLLGNGRTWIAAGVAGSAAVAAFALPLRLNIVIAIAAAVAIGLVMDRAWPAGEPRRPSGRRA